MHRYNAEFLALKGEVRAGAAHAAPVPFVNTLVALIALRLAMVWAAWRGDVPVLSIVALSALQFVLAPHSLFVAVTQALALLPPLFVGPVLVAIAGGTLADSVRSAVGAAAALDCASWGKLRVTYSFVVIFFAVDQLVCATCFWSGTGPKGPTARARVSARKLATHVAFGFVNAKTYTLVLLLLMASRGVQLDLLVWAVDARLGLSTQLCDIAMRTLDVHWQTLFYHQHRLAHLPRVYEHAHKLHHYLHDSTAFDAHNYGSGLPEEWLLLMLELAVALYWRKLPPTLCFHVLVISWTNKVGHTRGVDGSDGKNYHCDHHTYHNKNFGIFSCVLDLCVGWPRGFVCRVCTRALSLFLSLSLSLKLTCRLRLSHQVLRHQRARP